MLCFLKQHKTIYCQMNAGRFSYDAMGGELLCFPLTRQH
jgi:hypothetical protein